MKEDYKGNGQLKAVYNVQIGTENQFVAVSTLHQRPGNTSCMVEHLKGFKRRFKSLPHVLVADAGYGSKKNYAYLEKRDVQAFVKYNPFRKEQKCAFKKDPNQSKNWSFDELTDEWTCAGGRKLSFRYEKKERSSLGYESITRIHCCKDCSGCPRQRKCAKSDDESKIALSTLAPTRGLPKEG